MMIAEDRMIVVMHKPNVVPDNSFDMFTCVFTRRKYHTGVLSDQKKCIFLLFKVTTNKNENLNFSVSDVV